jgi:hypothetical protein
MKVNCYKSQIPFSLVSSFITLIQASKSLKQFKKFLSLAWLFDTSSNRTLYCRDVVIEIRSRGTGSHQLFESRGHQLFDSCDHQLQTTSQYKNMFLFAPKILVYITQEMRT